MVAGVPLKVASAAARSLSGSSGSPTPTPTPTPTSTLAVFAAGVARVRGGTGRAIHLAIGDSTTAGWGGGAATGKALTTTESTSGNANYARRGGYPYKLAEAWTAAGVPARADGFFGNGRTTNQPSLPESLAANPNLGGGANWVLSNISSAPSIGGSYYGNTSTTDALTFTPDVAADRFDLYFVQYESGATFTVSDASGVLATINAQNATRALGKATIVRASGTGAISIQRTGTGTGLFVVGILPYDTVDRRLEVVNGGWGSSRTTDWKLATNGYQPYPAIGSLGGIDLITINLGVNDKNQGSSLATFQADLQTVAAQCKGTGADVVLVKPIQPTTTSAGYYLPQAWLAAIDTVTANLSLQPAADLFAGISLDTADGGDYWDVIHLAASGYQKVATYLRANLAARIGL